MHTLELVLDIAILTLLVGLLLELRRSKKPGFEKKLEEEMQKEDILNKGAEDRKQEEPQRNGVNDKKEDESPEYEKAYGMVTEMLEKGYSVEKIVNEVRLIPEQEVRLIAKLKRPRRAR